jgi:hypothetical protein
MRSLLQNVQDVHLGSDSNRETGKKS